MHLNTYITCVFLRPPRSLLQAVDGNFKFNRESNKSQYNSAAREMMKFSSIYVQLYTVDIY